MVLEPRVAENGHEEEERIFVEDGQERERWAAKKKTSLGDDGGELECYFPFRRAIQPPAANTRAMNAGSNASLDSSSSLRCNIELLLFEYNC